MKKILFILSISVCLLSCKKYLSMKPDKALVIPETVAQVQSLLDNDDLMNRNAPFSGEGSADDYYLTSEDFDALTSQTEKSIYLWEEEIIYDLFPNDWSFAYDPVGIANTALHYLGQIEKNKNNETGWNEAQGSALFFRANYFLGSAFIWSKPYDRASAATDLGIPLRLTHDFTETSVRASVAQVYQQITGDLKEAAALLPLQSRHPVRPSRAAAYGLLSRAYLAMREYEKAGLYADSCLQLHATLLDYNALDPGADFPFARFNPEVIMYFTTRPLGMIFGRMDSLLYRSYEENDLRKALFFRDNGDGSYGFKGSYDESLVPFCGLAADEMYLIRAECNIRSGNIGAGLEDLNHLLANRYKTGTFNPVVTTNRSEALRLVLSERRKELLLRNLRWMDVKRLNKEDANITISRLIGDERHTLAPNENRYALPLPRRVIAITGMEQNPR